MAEALAAIRPMIAYSCTTHDFPRHAHRQILDAADLRWLHVGGSGFDHFSGWDLSRITLTNGRGVLAEFQADMIMGAITALEHDLLTFKDAQARKQWCPRTRRALAGLRLLVVGPGAIGSALARRARAHGLVTMAASRTPRPLEHFDEVGALADLEALVAQADIVSLHLPSTSATRGLIDQRILARMRRDSLLVNTARGAIVDEDALIAALRQGRPRAAYLDVFAKEPLLPSSPLWGMPNVLITPHCSDQVEDWELRHARFFMDNLERWLDGAPLENIV